MQRLVGHLIPLLTRRLVCAENDVHVELLFHLTYYVLQEQTFTHNERQLLRCFGGVSWKTTCQSMRTTTTFACRYLVNMGDSSLYNADCGPI